mgnify:CR=1 FL=1
MVWMGTISILGVNMNDLEKGVMRVGMLIIVGCMIILYLNHTPPLTSINGEIVKEWPNHPSIDKHYIKDVRDQLHEYSLPVIMHSHTELVQYCKIHHGWEVLKAYWNHKEDDYDYFVRKHKKF